MSICYIILTLIIDACGTVKLSLRHGHHHKNRDDLKPFRYDYLKPPIFRRDS